jgi:putative mRNA 3-end processing factor
MVLYSPGRTSSYPEEAVKEGLRFHYLGGGNEVGNVGCILEDATGTRLLLDYGLAPTDPPRYPNEAPKVTDCIITHSHIDHLGMAPWLASHHSTRLHGTALTGEIARPMWNDCYKVSRIEGYPLSWDKRDIDEAVDLWQSHGFDEKITFHNWKWRLLPAGHIPGAAMVNIETPTHRILFTGDFDTRDSGLVNGAEPVKCDILFIEGTYGGRSHPPKQHEQQRFLDRVSEVVGRGGTCLVPAFANGRTQDVLILLHQSSLNLNVHIDGMGKFLAKLYLEHPEYLRSSDDLEAALAWAKKVSSKSDRKKALDADVIITTSGMLDGGPSIWYVNRLRDNPENAILLTGYQARGSGGRKLLDQGKLPIFGTDTQIDLEVDQFTFSTHSGHDEILNFAQQCEAKHVVIYHTDPVQARPPLVVALEAQGHTVHCPINGESYTIVD